MSSEAINTNIKGWIGVGCTLLPIIRITASFFGLGHFVEAIAPIFDSVCVAGGTVGTYLLAKSDKLGK